MKPNRVEGRKGKGGEETRKSVIHKNTLFSKTTARILEAISEGPCYGLATPEFPEKSVYFDGIPLMNDDETTNFEGVTVVQRYGQTDQKFINGFQDVEFTTDVSEKVEQASPVEAQFTGIGIDAVRVTMRIPSLSYVNSDNGDVEGKRIDYKIELQIDSGGYFQVTPIPPEAFATEEGKNLAPYEFSIRLNLDEYFEGDEDGTGINRTYDIRVTRVSEDYDDKDYHTGDLYFQNYTTIQERS